MPTIGAYVDDETYDKAKKIADENHTSISKIVLASFEKVEVKNNKSVQEILLELNRITNFLDGVTNNFNQIAKHINTQKYLDKEVLKVLLSIEAEMQNFQQVKSHALQNF